MVQAVAFSSVLPRWKSYTQSNSPSRYYVLEKILIPIVLYTNRGDGDFFFLSILLNTEVSQVSPTRPERAEAPSPGHRPGYLWTQTCRPVRAKALYIARYLKAFALTGRKASAHNNPGRCPGLGASALSGRVG